MGSFEQLKQKRTERMLIAAVRSADWGVAEHAIKRVPAALDADTALGAVL